MGMLRGGGRVSPVPSPHQGTYRISPHCAESPVQVLRAMRNHHPRCLSGWPTSFSSDPALSPPTLDEFVSPTPRGRLIPTEDGSPRPTCAGQRNIDHCLRSDSGGGNATRALYWTMIGPTLGQAQRPGIRVFRGSKGVLATPVLDLAGVAGGHRHHNFISTTRDSSG